VDDNHEWMAHACLPIADPVDERVLRIYVGPRDRRIGSAVLVED
jgi:hypothetical protein